MQLVILIRIPKENCALTPDTRDVRHKGVNKHLLAENYEGAWLGKKKKKKMQVTSEYSNFRTISMQKSGRVIKHSAGVV